MNALGRAALTTPDGLLATALGVGLVPRAPGTAGSIAALLPAWWLVQAPVPIQGAVVVVAFAVGVLACRRFEQRVGRHDHGAVVWDEVVGMWITLLGHTPSVGNLIAGLLLFRIFDIAKPPPVGWVDRRLGGGLGVMLDDVVAGAMASVTLWLASPLLP